MKGKILPPKPEGHRRQPNELELDGIVYPTIDSSDVPSGTASVPVKLDDNGNIHPCVMVAGSVGRKLTSSGDILTPSHRSQSGVSLHQEMAARERLTDDKAGINEAAGESMEEKGEPGLDTLQPVSGWWIFEKA